MHDQAPQFTFPMVLLIWFQSPLHRSFVYAILEHPLHHGTGTDVNNIRVVGWSVLKIRQGWKIRRKIHPGGAMVGSFPYPSDGAPIKMVLTSVGWNAMALILPYRLLACVIDRVRERGQHWPVPDAEPGHPARSCTVKFVHCLISAGVCVGQNACFVNISQRLKTFQPFPL